MAITHDNSESAGATSLSNYTINNGSGNDRAVIAGGTGQTAPTNMTLNSTNGTKVGGAGTGETFVEMYSWDDGQLPAGSGDYTVAQTGGSGSPTTGAMGFTGTNQVKVVNGFATATGSSTTATVNISTGSSDKLVVDTAAVKDATWGAIGANQTVRYTQTGGTPDTDIHGSGSTEPGNGGTVTMSRSISGTPENWAIVAAEINEAVGGATAVPDVFMQPMRPK